MRHPAQLCVSLQFFSFERASRSIVKTGFNALTHPGGFKKQQETVYGNARFFLYVNSSSLKRASRSHAKIGFAGVDVISAEKIVLG